MTFVIWAFASWTNKKKLFLLLILAMLSHNTAISVLVVVTMVHLLFFSKKTLIVIWFVSLINYIFAFSDGILSRLLVLFERIIPSGMKGRYSLYFFEATSNRTVSLFYLVYFFLVFLLIWSSYRENRKETDDMLDFSMFESEKMLNIGVIGLTLMSVGATFSVIVRVTDYLIVPCIIFLVPGYIRKHDRVAGKGIVLILCSVALALYLRIYLNATPLYFF